MVIAALVISLTGLARYLGAEPPPMVYYAIVVALVVGSLLIVEGTKRFFHAHLVARHR